MFRADVSRLRFELVLRAFRTEVVLSNLAVAEQPGGGISTDSASRSSRWTAMNCQRASVAAMLLSSLEVFVFVGFV